MITRNYAQLIAQEMNLAQEQVQNTLDLLDGGATIPFISRYRKEATGSLDEVQIGQIRDLRNRWVELDKRRAAILDSIREQGKLTPELEAQIEEAATLGALEDLYLPYRPKRKTRASVAVERGLEPLAKMLIAQRQLDLAKVAQPFVNPDKGVADVEAALAGARDIIAERVSENVSLRARLRSTFRQHSRIRTRLIPDKVDEGEKYRIYYHAEEFLPKAPSHRVLAMLRGEEEGILRLTIAPDEEKTLSMIKRALLKNNTNGAQQVWMAAEDAYKRLLQPQMETEMRKYYKDKADTEAIGVFVQNLRQLLMAAPLGQVTTLAVDPGFRTGCKVVILNPQGKLLHNETIYPHPPVAQYRLASDKLKRLVLQYKVDAIAIGNGTAGRETENFIRHIPFERDVKAFMVNESGASVYSASPVARAEFPDYDVTVRGAVSIGRRLMDPLAELVKIDPKSIGVGQYQHDVNQKRLQESLEATVESCVNRVGVELNTASKELLSYVSGVGPALAQNIVDYRNEHGAFPSRESLRQVPRFGAKAFEQAAGFLRIRDAENPLDRSAVHPESYPVVQAMARDMQCSVSDLMSHADIRKNINLTHYLSDKVGMPTLTDIMSELDKPGRDPRSSFEMFEFDKNVRTINDVQPGMVLPGIVTNITNFGCFVDIGVHQDGLIHVSNMADHRINNPHEVVHLNQKVMVRVIGVETDRKRISLSLNLDK
ncbi:MAG: RNA-binding transcriptional accessory protein [Bacteroidales bacterium]|nr:RNA-binding transcriptional accessory protein [Bacteroidales bacterium]MBR6162218.1 RNA-binding transcriptional accessory protein [Bacteroidales bacterium]